MSDYKPSGLLHMLLSGFMGSVHLWTMISCDLAGHDNSSKQDPRTGTDHWIISFIYNVGNSMPETSHLGMTFIPPIKLLILGMVYVMLKSSKRFLALSDLHQSAAGAQGGAAVRISSPFALLLNFHRCTFGIQPLEKQATHRSTETYWWRRNCDSPGGTLMLVEAP